jgi:hypothetical protein
MKNKFVIGLFCLLAGCGPNRDFEGKNSFGSQGSAGATTSTSSGYVEPEWPIGDAGVGLSQVIPEGLEWMGYKENQESEKPVPLKPRDWYDPTGESGINAVLVITAKHQCDLCEKEADLIPNGLAAWNSMNMGIKVITLIVTNPEGKVATPDTALAWKKDHYHVDAAVGADPLAIMLPDAVFAMPYHTIVDPRTMRVIGTQEGIVNDYKMLEDLASANLQK